MHQTALWLVGFIAVMGVIYYFLVHKNMKEGNMKDGTETPDPLPAAPTEAADGG